MDGDLSFSLAEYCTWEEISYKWARSIDTKDWEALRAILTPKIMYDYTKVYGVKDENMSAEDYIALASGVLNDPEIVCQHLLAAATVRKLSPTTATAWRQLRAAHMRIARNPRKEVKAHAHGILQFFYEKSDDGWKISGITGWGDFMEGDILSVFPSWPGKGNVDWI